MTAQQQLESILASSAETGHVPATAVDFIREHGPMLSVLMMAYVDRKSAVEAMRQTEYNSAKRLAAIKAYDAADDAIFAALRKLTQDA